MDAACNRFLLSRGLDVFDMKQVIASEVRQYVKNTRLKS
jgi:hypothetical protein